MFVGANCLPTETTTYETITLKSAYSTASCKAARVGNVVTIYLNNWTYADPSWLVPLNDTNLPTKYRPKHTTTSYILAADGNPAYLSISDTGKIEVKRTTGTGSAAWTVTYLA